MSSSCHDDHSCGHNFEGLSDEYKRVLWIVAGANLLMFIVELLGGHLAGSMALQADALDFLADSLTYAVSLWAIGKPLKLRGQVAIAKGVSLGLMGLYVMIATIYRVFVLGVPEAFTMSIIGFLAFATNVGSVLLLYRWRNGDANVRSVWLCSRNDAIGNVAVMIAALMVGLTQSGWPDVIVAFIMAALFLSSSWQIIRQAVNEMRLTKASDA